MNIIFFFFIPYGCNVGEINEYWSNDDDYPGYVSACQMTILNVTGAFYDDQCNGERRYNVMAISSEHRNGRRAQPSLR